jgi:hypothetical protein
VSGGEQPDNADQRLSDSAVAIRSRILAGNACGADLRLVSDKLQRVAQILAGQTTAAGVGIRRAFRYIEHVGIQMNVDATCRSRELTERFRKNEFYFPGKRLLRKKSSGNGRQPDSNNAAHGISLLTPSIR